MSYVCVRVLISCFASHSALTVSFPAPNVSPLDDALELLPHDCCISGAIVSIVYGTVDE